MHGERNVIVNAFSVDVEEYFQVENFAARVQRDQWERFDSRLDAVVDRLLEMLAARATHGTFFVLAWHAERLRPLVRRIHQAGHEIASHGCSHRLVYEQTPAEFRDEVRRSKRLLEDMTGSAVLGYRAPSYSITERSLWALDILREEGFAYDSSVYPMRRKRYGIPDAPRHPHRRAGGLIEFPLTTWRVAGLNVPAASGGYLRILPLGASLRAIGQLNAAGHPAVVNVHPWELDPEQPRLGGGYLGGFTHYANLRGTASRLAALLDRFPFTTLWQTLVSQGLVSPPQAGECAQRAT
jgi:polysaccharide deacetylase family protein (PEP-CTERM system associated)